MNKNLIITILVLMLIATFLYIGVEKYNEKKVAKEVSIFEQGAGYGYQQAIVQVMQQASTCEQVPMYAGNLTLNLIAVECLQKVQG